MSKPTNSKPARQCRLQWVPADDLRVNPVAQREFRPAWARQILTEFDIDKFQVPHVNRRADGSLFIMEGQHSVWAYREALGEDQQVQVWIYDGLTEEEEADFFLALNNKKSPDAMAKFKVAVTAGRPTESDIDRIVRAAGCAVSSSPAPNHISAVSALATIYRRHGAENLARTLATIRDAFSEGGYERPILLGLSMVLARYPDLDQVRLVSKLSGLRNGWKGVLQKTATIKEQMGQRQDESAAAAIVELYNAGRGGRKLPSWWRTEEAA